MMKSPIKIVTITAALVLAMSSCTYDNLEELYGYPYNCPTDSVKYSVDVSKIVQSSCAVSGCHLDPAAAGGVDLSTYQSVFDNKENIRDRINRPTNADGHMPLGGVLNPCSIDEITAWIDMGAPNN